jgi:hypothetical protein
MHCVCVSCAGLAVSTSTSEFCYNVVAEKWEREMWTMNLMMQCELSVDLEKLPWIIRIACLFFFEIKGTHPRFINETSELQKLPRFCVETLPQHRFSLLQTREFSNPDSGSGLLACSYALCQYVSCFRPVVSVEAFIFPALRRRISSIWSSFQPWHTFVYLRWIMNGISELVGDLFGLRTLDCFVAS